MKKLLFNAGIYLATLVAVLALAFSPLLLLKVQEKAIYAAPMLRHNKNVLPKTARDNPLAQLFYDRANTYGKRFAKTTKIENEETAKQEAFNALLNFTLLPKSAGEEIVKQCNALPELRVDSGTDEMGFKRSEVSGNYADKGYVDFTIETEPTTGKVTTFSLGGSNFANKFEINLEEYCDYLGLSTLENYESVTLGNGEQYNGNARYYTDAMLYVYIQSYSENGISCGVYSLSKEEFEKIK